MDAAKKFTVSTDGWGRWVAEPKAFLVVAPFWLAFSLLGVPQIGQPRVLVVAIVANIVALSGCFGLLVLARLTVFARREHSRVSVFAVVALGVVIGAAKAVITVSLIAVLVPDPGYVAALPSRVLGAAATGAWLLPVSALFLVTRERFLTERERLLGELSSRETNTTVNYATGLGTVADDVRQFLSQAQTDLHTHQASPRELRRFLHKGLTRQLRRLTRQLAQDPTHLFEGSSFRDLVAITIRTRSYPLAGVAIVHLLLTAPFVFFQVGLGETLGRAVISTGILVSTLWVAKRLPTGGFVKGLSLLLSGLVSWVVINELLAFTLFGPFGDIPFWMTAFANFTVALSHTVLLGAMRVATDQSKSIRSHLDTLLSEKYWQRDISTLHSLHQRRALAQHLHGRLQSVLLATIIRLKKNPQSVDCEELRSELSTLASLLSDNHETPPAEPISLNDAFRQLCQRWEGMLTVDWDVSQVSTALSAEDIRAIADVAEESMSNAVRHGMATSITLAVETGRDGLSLIATDNGIGPRLGPPGLGSILYSSLPDSSWSLDENPHRSGSTLRVVWR